MLGVDLLEAGTLLVLAAAGQQEICPQVKPAEINIIPKTKEIRYDSSRPMAAIQGAATDTINPYGFHGVTRTQGFMEGTIKLSHTVKLDNSYNARYGAVCLWYDKIDIVLEIDPEIVVAKEVYADPCMRKSVINHEMKHIDVDRRIVNKYSKILGQKIYGALKERGFRAQPVSPDNAQEMATRMQTIIAQLVEFEYRKLDIERTEAQQAVDNVKEYDSVAAQCPEFQKKLSQMESAASKNKKKQR